MKNIFPSIKKRIIESKSFVISLIFWRFCLQNDSKVEPKFALEIVINILIMLYKLLKVMSYMSVVWLIWVKMFKKNLILNEVLTKLFIFDKYQSEHDK